MIEILQLITLTHLWVNSEPTILLRSAIGFKEKDYDKYSPLKKFIHRLITCSMCSGFYIGLIFAPILHYSLLNACIISIGSEVLARVIRRL